MPKYNILKMTFRKPGRATVISILDINKIDVSLIYDNLVTVLRCTSSDLIISVSMEVDFHVRKNLLRSFSCQKWIELATCLFFHSESRYF
jgi:hypothetical protein